ncbi:zinc finger protein 37 [Folsomia candida]|nr:zinc finger protein 37 [Folsomia candida]
MQVPYQVALYEMDSQGVYSLRENDIEMIATSDSDFAVYNCRNILYDMDEFGWGYYYNSQEDIPFNLGIPEDEYDPEMILKMAILRGNDFHGGIPGIGPKKCLEITKSASALDIESLLQTTKEIFPAIYSKIPDVDALREGLLKAEYTFKHATVFDATTGQQLCLTPPPTPELKQQIQVYAGPFKDANAAAMISKGLLHPITHCAIPNIKDPSAPDSGYDSSCFWNPDYKRPSGFKIFERGPLKTAEELGLDDRDSAPRKKKKKQKYECTVKDCTKSFKTFGSLKQHLIVHSGKRHFDCRICGKAFKQKSVLDRHSVIHTKAKPFKCSICQKRFSWSANYFYHLRRHEGIKPFPCRYCNKSFSQRQHLTEHINIHLDLRPFVCNEEGCEAFAQYGNLWTHKKTHLEDRPFTCSICQASFKQKAHLDSHNIAKHRTPGGHVCRICNLVVASSAELKKHTQSHNPPTFKCLFPGCGMKFKYASALKRHSDNQKNHDFTMKRFKCSEPDVDEPDDECPRRYSSQTALNLHKRNDH